MQDGRQFRIYPNVPQQIILKHWIGCQRSVQNAKTDEVGYQNWLRHRAFFNNIPREGQTFNEAYAHFKTEANPWLAQVPSQILRNGIYRAKAAFTRYWSGQNGRPNHRHKSPREAVMVTRELFEFREGALFLGSVKKPEKMQRIKLNAHRPFGLPNMIWVVKDNDNWLVSFAFEPIGPDTPTNEELLLAHREAKEDEILALDRGVVHPFFDSTRTAYDPDSTFARRLQAYDTRIVCLQRKLARQKKGSKRREDTKTTLAKVFRKRRRLIGDWQHKTTAKIVGKAEKVVALEDLKLPNMTKAPEPKTQNPCGDYPPNGRAAKAGLNRSMLELGLGTMATQIGYKANRQGKALVKITPFRSSQECSLCKHTHADNRKSQAEFHCQACGNIANADHNAALVVRNRAQHFLSSLSPMGNMATPNAREDNPTEKPPA